ncbi:MAG: tRNA (adenosine(37)-N6)-threonylcarbamoyltransferase complex ATPase subunit type 1 TsaE [Pseudomonadota bacterium]
MSVTIRLEGDAATLQLANDIAMVAEADWVIRLEGDLGAGKSTFARGFIRALACDPRLEVPSPTYTLVQAYEETSPPVLHADLYRLGDPSEVVELGLSDPGDRSIRLIEWPDKAGKGAFAGALTIHFTMDDEAARQSTIDGPPEKLARVERSLAIHAFLDASGRLEAQRQRMLGDASTRRYERLAGQPVILMDAPRQPDGPIIRDGKSYSQLVHLAESVHAFAAVGTALRARGFAAPAILASDLDQGLLLLEDLGGEGVLDDEGAPDRERYYAAATLLADLHAADWQSALPVPGDGTHTLHRYDSEVFLTEIDLCAQWYLPYRGIKGFDVEGFEAAWRLMLAPLEDEPSTLTLRDFHSPNLLWRSAQTGVQRLGLIDHQDALLGPPAYDLASLVHDARVTVPPALQAELIATYVDAAGQDLEHVKARFALMTAQRNTKLLGIFVRLSERDGKSRYLAHLPRVETYLRQVLEHPVLADVKAFYDILLPPTQA